MRKLPLIVLIAIIHGGPSHALAEGRVDCSRLDSHILHRAVRYCVMLPSGYETDTRKRYPVLYFLHGLGENEQTLVESGGWDVIQDLAHEKKVGEFVMAAPEGGASFFINSVDGHDPYGDFFLGEFLPYIEAHYRLLGERRSRGITGLSMGGYGALRFAFADPERFGSVSAQSPALITESLRQLDDDLRDAGPLARLLGSVFGDPIRVAHWNRNNPFQLARQHQAELRSQAIYFNCGEQDEYGFEIGAEALDKQLREEKIAHQFHLFPGGHNAEYFLSHLGETIEFHWRAFTREPTSGGTS
jgi:S-formylglutathione hydrolase FrmB